MAASPKLTGASVYIYSFLDMRPVEFGQAMLDQLDLQLQTALSASNATSKVLRFRDSQPGASFAPRSEFPTYGITQSTDKIPIGETIASNFAAERAFRARYRLIVYPNYLFVSGPWRVYTIHWMLFDCATNNIVWSHNYNGRSLIWLTVSESGATQARPVVKDLVAGLKADGLL